MSIAVAVVEDDEDLRTGVAALIRGTTNFSLAGSYGSAEAALRGIPEADPAPTVVLMDINLPKLSGIEAVRRLKAQMPQLQIIMFTVCDTAEEVFPALAAGASGYLLKRTPPGKIMEAIEELHRHGAPMSPSIARMVVETFSQYSRGVAGNFRSDGAGDATPESGTTPGDARALTAREEAILRQLSKGLRYKEIAVELGVGVETVHTHVRHIYEKLHVTSRTEAVVKYLGRR